LPEKNKIQDNTQMPIIKSNHNDLFRNPTTDDKLTLFKLLLDTKELTVDLTLALLKIIHSELKNDQYRRDRSVYKRYAEAIESLRYHMMGMLQQVVDAWKNRQAAFTMPEEWFPDEKNK
jgi:hypothetical protein